MRKPQRGTVAKRQRFDTGIVTGSLRNARRAVLCSLCYSFICVLIGECCDLIGRDGITKCLERTTPGASDAVRDNS